MIEFTVPRQDYDLHKTLSCGQVFRWRQEDEWYYVESLDRICRLKYDGDNILLQASTVTATAEDATHYWMRYFGFNQDSYLQLLDKVVTDSFLSEIVLYNKGLHLLRQDPWETTVSFIISAQKRIPQIQSCIRKLCDIAGGQGWDDTLGSFQYFPRPQDIMHYDIKDAKLGYRELYVKRTAFMINGGYVNLYDFDANKVSYTRAMQELCALPGVGTKVANCIALFSLDHTQAFPVDVHIQKVLDLPQMQGFDYKEYGNLAGLLQEYIYNWALNHGL